FGWYQRLMGKSVPTRKIIGISSTQRSQGGVSPTSAWEKLNGRPPSRENVSQVIMFSTAGTLQSARRMCHGGARRFTVVIEFDITTLSASRRDGRSPANLPCERNRNLNFERISLAV